MKTSLRKVDYIVCLAPTSKGDFMGKFRCLVLTKLDNYFIPLSAFDLIFEFSLFYLLHLIFLKSFFFFEKLLISMVYKYLLFQE